ncbi:hypothetical protein KC19_11G137000 [Ceratodon purpureus]|uniref:Uncharacterized protein n=1 Tax=Ceratodon purpureus TaxID=3225 RepID=A0A8T0GH72_CERPU|nr:hypothetical protein KC19_11G137000 [Ceratodon purpureus]
MASSSYPIKAKESDQEDYDEEEGEDEEGLIAESVASAIKSFKKKVLCGREAYVKRRVHTNKERLEDFTGNLFRLDEERKRVWENKQVSNFFLLCIKSHQAYGALNGSDSHGERDGRLSTLGSGGLEKPISIISGFQTSGKTNVRPVKLPRVENVPPYTTWIYLDRNQRMTEDQSVVGRRRIYYDSYDNETLIASESEEDDTGDDDDKDEPKHDFSMGEDSLIWITVQELGLKPVVLTELSRSEVLDITIEEIEARYGILLKDSVQNGRSEFLLETSEWTSGAGVFSSQGRITVAELEQGSVSERNEFNEGTSNELVLFNSGEDTVSTENAVQAVIVSDNTCALQNSLDDDKSEPKDLLTAMDSFDNLFCRRCLVFDCRLHGCSQAIVHPSDRQQPWTGTEEVMPSPCSKDCYLLTDTNYITRTRFCLGAPPQRDVNGTDNEALDCPEREPNTPEDDDVGTSERSAKRSRTSSREMSCSSDIQAFAASTVPVAQPLILSDLVTTVHSRVVSNEKKLEKRPSATRRSLSRRAKQNCPRRDTTTSLKSQLSQEESIISLDSASQDFPKNESPPLKEEESSHQEDASNLKEVVPSKLSSKRSLTSNDDDIECNDQGEDDSSREGETVDEKVSLVPVAEVLCYEEDQAEAPDDTAKAEVGLGWNAMEKSLYDKGLQIFGGNSCLIARNLLQGCKTCADVAKYALELNAAGLGGVRRIADSLDIEAASRARLYGGRRKKGARKLKYTFKSVVHPLLRKRMTNGKDQTCRQYTPCNCLYTCGKQCPCLLNGTCCEKYCGCSKSCKNRFRGCHCAKSNCCSRQCPCFAAGRECDPDVCRNCWVGCGDGTIDGPPPRGDVNSTCRNMKLMLKQQQRVLLGRSAVAGWGAFLKSPVAKHEYLGEYTGELISHREADKRGKIYDRENSSFLFNLNDQYVLDACRKGDKLKFANHSLLPNCYAKVVMVSGDHRVGIFAKERITAGEELFYDYQYEPDRAPVWAKKPDDPNHKRDDTPSTTRRAQKAA